MKYGSYPFGRVEALEGNWIIATYLLSRACYSNVLDKTGSFAVGQTVGTWVKVSGMTEEMIVRRQGRVVQLTEIPCGGEEARFVIRIAFPGENFGDSLSTMLTALIGNDISTSLDVRLMDLEFTPGEIGRWSGPRHSMEDLRALAGVEEKRPLVLNMIKPCAGFSPEEGAKLFYDVASGGVDLIKDDELLASPGYNTVAERTRRNLKAAQSAYQVCGKRAVYFPNISGTPKQMRENAKAVIDAGAKACLVCFVFGAIDALYELTQEFGDKLFIMGHYAGAGVLANPVGGISDSVFLGLLPRLAGADSVICGAPNPAKPETYYQYARIAQAQTLPIGALRPMILAAGGGLTPISQAGLQAFMGPDSILGIGGAIQGHPMGTRAGAQAAMAAVEASAKGIPLEQASLECPPLARALSCWS